MPLHQPENDVLLSIQTIHELNADSRLPQLAYSGGHAVFMYGTAADGNVTLLLKEPDELDRGSISTMLAQLGQVEDGVIEERIVPSIPEPTNTNQIPYTPGETDKQHPENSSLERCLGKVPETPDIVEVSSNDRSIAAKDATDAGSSIIGSRLAIKRSRKATSPSRQGPQQCQICSKNFGNASALAKHKLTHSDERKYVCTTCGKAFKRQDHLNGHMLTHRNKKPYECKSDGCDKSYCDARSLRRHTENHHCQVSLTSSTTTFASLPYSPAAMHIDATSAILHVTDIAKECADTNMSPAQGTASGDAASPHSSSCIQYAPAPTSAGLITTVRTPFTTTVCNSSSSCKHKVAAKETLMKTMNNNSPGLVTSTNVKGELEELTHTGNVGIVDQSANFGQEKSQLQKLLATEPAQGVTRGSNDVLTKEQLDLIHLIMEQTQRQSQSITKAISIPTVQITQQKNKKNYLETSNLSSPNALVFNRRCSSDEIVKNQSSYPEIIKLVTSTSNITTSKLTASSAPIPPFAVLTTDSSTSHCHPPKSVMNAITSPVVVSVASSPTSANVKNETKPVECNLCHRKFKNIPALNGHMRLHGGYFKKDLEAKTTERLKDNTGPPLQTASVSVRALIEEKIINKRKTNTPIVLQQQLNNQHFVTSASLTRSANISSTAKQKTTNESKMLSAAKSATTSTITDPIFTQIKTSLGNANSIDLDAKITSFVVPTPPYHTVNKSMLACPPGTSNFDKNARTGCKTIQCQTMSCVSTEQVFKSQKQDKDNSSLLSGIRIISSCLKQDADTIDEYSSILNQQVSSPSLAEPLKIVSHRETFAEERIVQFENRSGDSITLAYQKTDTDNNDYTLKRENYQTVKSDQLNQNVLVKCINSKRQHLDDESLLQTQSEQSLHDIALAEYADIIHSPPYKNSSSENNDIRVVLDTRLPANLADFSTLHSSQYETREEKSPSFLSRDSPYPTPPASHEDPSSCIDPNTALCTTISLNPRDAINNSVDMNETQQVSSPLSSAFFTSTMSSAAAVEQALEEILPGECIQTDDLCQSLTDTPPPSSSENCSIHSKTTQPKPSATFPFTNIILQAHMMPNSNDPLLSSILKDFCPRKRLELNAIPVGVVNSSNDRGYTSTNFSSVMIKQDGESIGPHKDCTQEHDVITNSSNNKIVEIKTDDSCDISRKTGKKFILKAFAPSAKLKKNIIKSNEIDGFQMDSNLRSIFNRTSSPWKRPRMEPLQLPLLYQSRLRATRSNPQGFAPYTPLPILDPSRFGTGLYWNIHLKDTVSVWSNESIPESDSTPHINVGPNFQCSLPMWPLEIKSGLQIGNERTYEDLLWSPRNCQISKSDLNTYLDFACCAAVSGGCGNKEYAMQMLHVCDGNIQNAMEKLMQPEPMLCADHPLLKYNYDNSEKWSSTEADSFHHGLAKYDKDFFRISTEIQTKSSKQCIEFYYLWKRVCTTEYKRLKQIRERRHGSERGKEAKEKPLPDVKLLGIADTCSPIALQEFRSFVCEFPDCSASFNSRAALNGHIRIHGGTISNRRCPAQNQHAVLHSTQGHHSINVSDSLIITDNGIFGEEDYPCKICGKTFSKIKSRSAHMKSHRPAETDSSSPIPSCLPNIRKSNANISNTAPKPISGPTGVACSKRKYSFDSSGNSIIPSASSSPSLSISLSPSCTSMSPPLSLHSTAISSENTSSSILSSCDAV